MLVDLSGLAMSEARRQFAANLTALLGDKISPSDFARKIGVNRSTVSHWLHGKRWPDATQVDAMMEKYNWTMTQLFAGVDPPIEAVIKRHNASGSPFVIGLK